MKHAETVTFGGSRLDRVAQLRGLTDSDLAAHPRSAVVIWRGKPGLLRSEDGSVRIARLAHDHPIVSEATAPPLLIGAEEDGTLIEAWDISPWSPEDQDLTSLGAFLDPSLQVHPSAPDVAFGELRSVMVGLSARDAEIASTMRGLFEWHRTHSFCANCGTKSDIRQRGWQRDCPACGRHHFPRTDPVVIMLVLHGNSVLVGRSPGWPEGMYSLLAGFVEPGETIEAAVRRETFEETNVRIGEVTYLASQPWTFPASLMMGCRAQATTTEITVDPKELEDARWMTREEMMEAMAGRHPEVLGARKGAIAHFLLSNWLADTLD
ncbi:MAG: NAD(+) diphosphatase [Pseudomonadota bacterium]